MSFHDCKVVKDQCSYEEYHRQDAQRGDRNYSMSRSEAVEFALNPARWLAGFGIKDDSTTAMDWGSMIDTLLTSPNRFNELFAVAPETYPDSKTGEPKPFTLASKWCKEWKAQQGDKTIIKAAIKADADAAVKAIEADPIACELIRVSRKQVFVLGFWRDDATGIEVPVRGLIDIVPPADHPKFRKALCDFKTTRNGNPAQWARVVDDSAYDVQAALYLDLYREATKEDREDWLFIVQENVAPFHVVNPPPALTAEFIAWGRRKYQSSLALYAQCLALNKWPSYAAAGTVIEGLQFIGPDKLWRYLQTAGQDTMAFSRYDEPPAVPQPDEMGVTP